MTKELFLSNLEKTFSDCLNIAKKKNADYSGDNNDPFKNFKNVEVLGICSVEAGILTRMTDKMSRISNLINKEAQVKDESIFDSLDDLINYSAILKAYLYAKRNEQKTSTLPSSLPDYGKAGASGTGFQNFTGGSGTPQ